MRFNVQLKDFYLSYENQWQIDREGKDLKNGQFILEESRIIDFTTGRYYLNDNGIRKKCFTLLLVTPFLNTACALLNIAKKIALFATLSHFWVPHDREEYDFVGRYIDAAEDMLRIGFTLLSIIGLPMAALYGGLINPLNGRKLFATIERAAYGGSIFQQSFQPLSEPKAFVSSPDPINQHPSDFLARFEEKKGWGVRPVYFMDKKERFYVLRLNLIERLFALIVGLGVERYLDRVFEESDLKRVDDVEVSLYVETLKKNGVTSTHFGDMELIGF